ncbi:phosphatase PAP2 family protein [Microvirgula aerodenitrificans]|uniref:phosphatase PAP2 family protein n=1 Tax=Microvirgula aerodenitrificans TaxID=57480 RepID=UPI00248DD42A|nr:phosphatase PAP2 family protein [Microvirgula aerodenitrificans]
MKWPGWIAAAVFVAVATGLNTPQMAALDQSVFRGLAAAPAPFLSFAYGWDLAGKALPTLGIAALLAALAWRAGRRRDAGFLMLAAAGAWGVNGALKLVVERPRPPGMPDVGTFGSSFPSGHAMGTTALYAALAWLLASRLQRPGARIAVWLALAVWLTLTALTRPALGVHYFSDVLAGTAAGLAWVALCVSWHARSVGKEYQ